MKTPFDPSQSVRDVQHFGEEGGVVPVIDVAATSTFLKPDDMERVFRGEMQGCYLYSRHSNPSVTAFGKKMAAIEGMPAALGVASGMAAISCAVEQIFLNASGPATAGAASSLVGGHIVSSKVVYGGTYALFANVLPKRGITTTFVDPNDLAAIEKAITPETKLIYTETMSNPLLAISHLKALSELAKKKNVKLVVDNTFTPVLISAGRHGADVVVYSCTKYISGASDLIAGAIVSDQAFIDSLIDINSGLVMLTGPVMDPRIAHELYLRLDHLPLRMQAHSKSAAFLAAKMSEAGVKVIYPGLKDHPQHARMKELMNPEYGFGGMLTVECGSMKQAMKLAGRLQEEKFGLYAVSLGFSRTLISCPSSSTSSEIPEEEQKLMGLNPGLLRLSIGFVGNDEVMAERFLHCYREVVQG
ncbi:MAG: aminotransferase class I/II-fold pyridoxal phosphate-dependent enzyme [Methylotenera sp.]|nr:aminotransferase class I/II-fold pyridoxal phosphate-dependent enzyme [Oligoflexia bacterium]